MVGERLSSLWNVIFSYSHLERGGRNILEEREKDRTREDAWYKQTVLVVVLKKKMHVFCLVSGERDSKGERRKPGNMIL